MSNPLSHEHGEGLPYTDDLLILSGVDGAINAHYPELLPAFHAALAVVGAMAIADRTRPLSLILESGSGNGKTEVIQSLFPRAGSGIGDFIYRSDKFTPKSFVTHASTIKKTERGKTDLLPKLRDKVLLTKELAPMFRGREQDMQDNFSTLISVLDGQGFISDSGTCGRRGYEEQIVFNWLGATTPLPASTHRLMSALGTRLLFYEVPATKPNQDDLVEYAMRNAPATVQDEVREKVNAIVATFFLFNPIGSVSRSSIDFPPSRADELVCWARLLVDGRAAVIYEKKGSNWTPVAAMPPEGVWKVIEYLKELAFGNALIHGRDFICDSDIALCKHVAVSSVPGHLRPLLRELGERGAVDTTRAMDLCRVTAPTARNYLDELALLGIARLRKGAPTTNKPDSVVLAKKYSFLKP